MPEINQKPCSNCEEMCDASELIPWDNLGAEVCEGCSEELYADGFEGDGSEAEDCMDDYPMMNEMDF